MIWINLKISHAKATKHCLTVFYLGLRNIRFLFTTFSIWSPIVFLMWQISLVFGTKQLFKPFLSSIMYFPMIMIIKFYPILFHFLSAKHISKRRLQAFSHFISGQWVYHSVCIWHPCLNIFRPRHFLDDIFNVLSLLKISVVWLKFPRRLSTKPLPGPVMVNYTNAYMHQSAWMSETLVR